MINLCLYGGLGNQIFQLSAAMLFAKKKNINHINIDTSIINNFDAKFGLQIDDFFSFETSDISVTFRNSIYTRFRLPKIKIFRCLFSESFISDGNFQSSINSKIKKSNYYFDGYFQECITQENFEKMIPLLKSLLNFKFKILEDDQRLVIIHIRGGDFLKLNRNPCLNKSFYLNSLKNYKNIEKIKVVTDDPDYSKTIFQDCSYDIEIVSSNIKDDFILIGSYSNRILSPSTFSFWASALGCNPKNSKVYAWQYWYDSIHRNIKLPNEQN